MSNQVFRHAIVVSVCKDQASLDVQRSGRVILAPEVQTPVRLHLHPTLFFFLFHPLLKLLSIFYCWLSIYLSVHLSHSLSLSQLVSHILFYLWTVRSLIKAVSRMGGDTTDQDSAGYGWKATKPCNQTSCVVRLDVGVCGLFLCWCDCEFVCCCFFIFLLHFPDPVLASFCLIAPLMFCVAPRAWRVPNLLLFGVFVKPQTRQMAVKSLRWFSAFIFRNLIKIARR